MGSPPGTVSYIDHGCRAGRDLTFSCILITRSQVVTTISMPERWLRIRSALRTAGAQAATGGSIQALEGTLDRVVSLHKSENPGCSASSRCHCSQWCLYLLSTTSWWWRALPSASGSCEDKNALLCMSGPRTVPHRDRAMARQVPWAG